MKKEEVQKTKKKKKKRERQREVIVKQEDEEEKILMIGDECIQVPFHHLCGRTEEKQTYYPYSLPLKQYEEYFLSYGYEIINRPVENINWDFFLYLLEIIPLYYIYDLYFS